ncbi:hypothetical protein BKA67DRAFT_509967 [Truncatella angustata]|uniref:Carrier domain-containing protein n=1 Tax=Truncatella angustata TaxID=152316 RepID=A0A9P8UVS5_9PEZI|nr:uncharacterized protein BKA67DRAFT_509967 [Truncatella angustata]KAH6658934.1 hypothetical protein BKA67DRAFT_509967 [Truncatella angustata]
MDIQTPIAVIGMACRFAGDVDSPEKLWKICAEGRSAWTEIPKSRFNVDGVYHPNNAKQNTLNIRGGHFLTEDPALFDANFFNLSSEVAASIDPQFRLQLESTYEAFESAGLTLQDVAGSNTSVYAGAFFRDYIEGHMRDPETLPRFLLMGIGAAMASNRISHFYDLRGPSMTIDTGCSTTLTAFHQACQSLRTRESNMSIVGGANVTFNPDMFVVMSSLTLLSPEGKSFSFDSRASGYGRGEGSATVLLKRLDDALRDGDPIRAVIRETGANQDGRTDTITTPSGVAQEELIRECYRKSGLDPAHTTYFEAHGTGTPTGDPIEAGAIASVFKNSRSADQPLRLGSVKSNIGHTETASGLASIIKVVKALEKGQIPPSINFEKPNPKLDLPGWKLKVPTELETWNAINGIRRASVNNFGYGGANAHVIMEDFASFVTQRKINNRHVSTVTNGKSNENSNGTNGQTSRISNETNDNGVHAGNGLSSHVFVLSAKDERAAQTMIENLQRYLTEARNNNEVEERTLLKQLAFTLGQRRSRFSWVSSVAGQSLTGLLGAFSTPKAKPVRSLVNERKPRLGFVFTGQGAQWWAMGRELIHTYPVFRQSLEESEEMLKDLGSPWSLLEELTRDAETSKVSEQYLSMPACVAIQIALVQLLDSWDIRPSAITSHSSGEIAGAYAAGALSKKSAIAIGFARGQFVAKAKGGMIAVGLGVEDCDKYLARISSGKLVAACMNSPSSTTVSGDVPAIEELEALLKADEVFARRLRVDAAYHSHHMQAFAEPYEAWIAKNAKPGRPQKSENGHFISDTLSVVFSSPTTGGRIENATDLCDAGHWARSLVNPVRFVEAFKDMVNSTKSENDGEENEGVVDMVLEVGPHGALGGPIQEILSLPEFAGRKVPYATCLVRKSSAIDTTHSLVCDLLRNGYPVNMDAVNFPTGRVGVKVIYDLPHYPWNHQVRYWSEPRQNRELRHRREAPHDLLGSLVLGTNNNVPSWKNTIKESDLPWIRDHTVQSNIVYPGAGFICMAIEAALQSWPKSGRNVSGYKLRDVDIHQALVIPNDSAGIETQIELRPCSEKAIYTKGWKEFVIHSVSLENDWIELCRGLISIEFEVDSRQFWNDSIADGQTSARLTQPVLPEDYRMRVMPRDIYANMRSVGIYHGPIFQNLKSIRAHSKQSVSTFVTADTASIMPYNYQREHVVHPTTLDSVFQSAYTAMPESRTTMYYALVPRFIKSLWISHNIVKEPGHLFRSYSNIIRKDGQSAEVEIVVCDDNKVKDASSVHPVMKLEGFELHSLGSSPPKSTASYENEKFSHAEWVPDLDLSPPMFAKQQLSRTIPAGEAEIMLDLRRACYYYVQDALSGIAEDQLSGLARFSQKFYTWMKVQEQLAQSNRLGDGSSEWKADSTATREALIEKVKGASTNGEMVCRMGPHILSILRQDITPLELMLEDKLLQRYYTDAIKWGRSHQQMGTLVKHFSQKNPRGKILEIGAGTGGTTRMILASLGTDDSGWGPLAMSYDFTDISSGFFEAAQERFAAWNSLVRYKKLDVEHDPAEQGFELGTYDLIVASQVLHATKNIERTMSNVRRLLKPGGKLFIMETTQDPMDLQFVFGLLPGWWLSEEPERELSPSLSIEMWDRVLHDTGFGGVELEAHDCENEEFYSFSIIASTALESSTTNGTTDVAQNVVLVVGDDSTLQQPSWSWIEKLRSDICRIIGETPPVETLQTASSTEGRTFIYLGDVDGVRLRSPNAESFEALKRLCTKSRRLLWVTSMRSLDASMSIGLLRSVREEYAGKCLIALDLDANREPWTAQSISAVIEVFNNVLLRPQIANGYQDFEFSERDGLIHVLRYFKDVEKNKAAITPSGPKQATQKEPFCQLGRPLKMRVGTAGLLDTLAFEHDLDADKELCANQLEIEPRAFGVNFRDIMVAMGQLGHDSTMGFECAGTVVRAGIDALIQGFKPGDRIMTLLHGDYASLIRVPWTNAVHIPDNVTFEVASTLPMVFTTAYVALFDIARLEKGESILIHAATGGVGQAACMLANHVGAEVFVTVGSEQKRDFVVKTYNVRPDHVFSSRDASFSAGILRMTGGEGVDVVLNSLAGPLLQEGFNCLARFGRFVEMGKRDFKINSHLEMATFNRAVSFSHIDLLQLEAHKGNQIQRVMRETIRLFSEGLITAVQPITVYPVSELEKTFRLMQAGKHMGKIIISVGPDDLVPVVPHMLVTKLNPQASYLVVGGLGGIGRSVCHWMVENGAKNLIVLSRSANSSQRTTSFVTEMAEAGCKAKAIRCNIAYQSDLDRALDDCRSEMPPIRGVVQAAMVLQDSILEQMSLADYQAAVSPKVDGSWNLHQAFNKVDSLDFFIMLSSLAGILGHPSQSNYSAGGSFQDALAHFRNRRGLPGAAIDLGVVSSVGYVAEHDNTSERLARSGHTILSEEDVLNAIKFGISSPFSGQMVLGLNPGPGPHWEETAMGRDMRFAAIRYHELGSKTERQPGTSAGNASDLGLRIAEASSLEEAADVVADAIVKKLMTIFMMQQSDIQLSKRLSEYGVDSLVAVELRNMLALRAGADVSIFDIMQNSSISKLARVVATKSSHLDSSVIV